jgi:hypothetical protein
MTKVASKAQGAGALRFLMGLRFAKNVRWKIITINSIVATPNQERCTLRNLIDSSRRSSDSQYALWGKLIIDVGTYLKIRGIKIVKELVMARDTK